MAIFVRHKFVSQKEDGPDNSVVRPSNWNDTHTIEMAGTRLMGKATAGAGPAEEVPLGDGLEFLTGLLKVKLGDGLEFNAGAIRVVAAVLDNIVPAGIMLPFTGNNLPAGWVYANNASLSRATYPRLWAHAQASGLLAATEAAKTHGQYGPGNGTTTFTVPNLTTDGGRFVRSVGSGRSAGAVEGYAVQSHSHTGTTSTNGDHAHPVTIPASGSASAGGVPILGPTQTTFSFNTGAAGAHAHTFTTNNSGIEETRPTNIAYPYIIKA